LRLQRVEILFSFDPSPFSFGKERGNPLAGWLAGLTRRFGVAAPSLLLSLLPARRGLSALFLPALFLSVFEPRWVIFSLLPTFLAPFLAMIATLFSAFLPTILALVSSLLPTILAFVSALLAPLLANLPACMLTAAVLPGVSSRDRPETDCSCQDNGEQPS